MANFMDAVNSELQYQNNTAITENGAVAYKTTGKALVDINFCIPQLRDMDDDSLFQKWIKAFGEGKELALRWLFFLRDVRGGIGERKTFRRIMRYIADHDTELANKLINGKVENEFLIPYFGRWDDVNTLLNTMSASQVFRIIKTQLQEDLKNMEEKKSVSLMAKWLPSVNTSSKETRELGKRVAGSLGMREKEYRQTLSKLRAYIDVIERKMSGNQWDEINYEAVPSKANLLYTGAFLKHDEERRRAYLAALEKGEAKINASVTFPHEIVHKLTHDHSSNSVCDAMWKALPNTITPGTRTMVVCDGSGSMMCPIPGGTSVTAMEVSNALAIYFAERMEGEFHNKFMTFGGKPQFVDISHCETIADKWEYSRQFNDCSNTNLEAVFMLILDTALKNHMSQEDLPTNLLFISDMEFDSGVDTRSMDKVGKSSWWGYDSDYRSTTDKLRESKLLDTIAARYTEAGYKLPRIIFWNVNSRTGAIPMIENDLGIALVSGYSVHIANMVMSGELDAYKCLVEQLMNERYNPVAAALA